MYYIKVFNNRVGISDVGTDRVKHSNKSKNSAEQSSCLKCLVRVSLLAGLNPHKEEGSIV